MKRIESGLPAHFEHWPAGLPHRISLPQTGLFYNIEVSASRFPDKPCLNFYGSTVSYARFKRETEAIAGWLLRRGVAQGDRVLLQMQNCPQFVIGYYAILRASAVVVPVNPMNTTAELRHVVHDSGARLAFVAQDLVDRTLPLLGDGLDEVLSCAYSDYIEQDTDLRVPDFVLAVRRSFSDPRISQWTDVLAADFAAGPVEVGPDDLSVMPYTSGTTGNPKGCMHTHGTTMHTLLATNQWFGIQQDAVFLAALPFFHVTGMQSSMNAPLHAGATIVILARWDRDVAAQLIERCRVTTWVAIPTMVIDFLSHPGLEGFDLGSLVRMSGGGAAMPETIAQKLLDRGITYVEGYGLSETIAATHINPPQRAKKQCLGIPVFNVEALVIDPDSLAPLEPGEVGEIVISGPQVFRGYWNRDSADAFLVINGQRFFRTGDLGRVDEDGYYYMVDRLKRMVNASGYKVWPAEVEAYMYQHPAVQEACVIGARDPRRGETVKCLVVLKAEHRDTLTEADLVAWSATVMSAYKYPRLVEFVDQLPKSATGKVLWRVLQDQELKR